MTLPDLVDNRKHRLADVLRDLIQSGQDPTLDAVTAFFNLKGLEVLSPEVERLVHLRMLLGKEQEQSFVVGKRLLAELEDATARAETTGAEIEKWRNFLCQDHVKVKLYSRVFCHGKAYIISGVPMFESIGIVGSSNFTGAGLTTNMELNAVLKQTSAVNELKSWFETLWAEAEDYKEELLTILERFTRTYSPYEIYIKVIYEALRDKLEQELSEKDDRPSPIALADFQRDGYLSAREIIENYGGVLISDSVGLGKTYLALRLLEDYAYRERQTALIICPAAVRETVWRPLLRQFAIPHEIVSMERVSQRNFPVDEYTQKFKIIVIDESHNFRNPNANRWENVYRIISRGDEDKKVILLTATPVNNTIFDLYHQLCLITRNDPRRLVSAGIANLREYFRRAEQNHDSLFEVLEALAVRRSRQFIRQHYPEAEIDGNKITFPERKLHTIRYSLKETYGPELYRRIAQTIENLLLAPYQIDIFRREVLEGHLRKPDMREINEIVESGEGAVERLQQNLGWTKEKAQEFVMTLGRQTALAHIMRVLYLKRLESSVESLKISLRRLYNFLNTFLMVLEQGRLLQSRDYRLWLKFEIVDDNEADEMQNMEAFIESLPELPLEQYDVEGIRSAVRADLDALEAILQELEQDHDDDKLETLKDLLVSPEIRGKKIVLFSYYKDTARYIYRSLREDREFLSALGHQRISIVDSDVKPEERSARIRRFAPRAHKLSNLPPEKEIDILISTDVLSEGQNLQDASILINYDLHWNPVRMVQRIGRLDRIGSPHTIIHIYNFFPEEELEELLGLLTRLHEKLEAINRTVGLDASILGETPNPMNFNILRRLENEDPNTLDELEAESELALGEFLKQDLLRFLKKVGEEKLKNIPLGVGTARQVKDGRKGFFAAFRNPKTNYHHWLFLDEEKNKIIDNRLEAIRYTRCEPEESPLPLPDNFDPRPLIQKLRKRLWNKIRQVQFTPGTLPVPQRQIINYLRALPPSAERNHLLQYFERRPLAGADLKELRRVWRNRSHIPQDEWLRLLRDFAQSHPFASTPDAESRLQLVPEREDDIECIAWMLVT